jgi:hypothetical protein
MDSQVVKNSGLIFLGIIIGVLALGIFDYYVYISPTLWSFNIIDLLSLIVYSLIAVYIAYYLRVRHSDKQIKKRLFLEVAEDIGKIFEDELAFLLEFMKANSEKREDRIKVLLKLRKINNKIYILEQHKNSFNDDTKKFIEEIKGYFVKIKETIDGDEDFIKPSSFSEDNINSVLKNSYDIYFKLDQVKLSIFD